MEEKKGIPAVAEALGYVGGALALGAVIAFLVAFWAEMGVLGHVGIGVLLAGAGLEGGHVLGRLEGAQARRLSHFLLAVGVIGVGFAVGFLVRDLVVGDVSTAVRRSLGADWGYFAGALAVASAGGIVWALRRSALQHIVFGVGVAAAALLVLPLIPIDGPEWGVGATLGGVAVVWGALSRRELLQPRRVGLALAALGVVGGFELMALASAPMLTWPLWPGVVAGALLIWAGSHDEEYVVLGVGAVGLTLFAGQLVGEYLGFGTGTAIALIGIGFVILGAAVRMMLRATPEASLSRRVMTEVLGYVGIALAMGGAGVLMSDAWEELGRLGRVIVPLVGSVVAYVCALAYERSGLGAARRLSQTLLAIGVLAAGIMGAMVAQPIAEGIFGPPGMNGDPASNWTMLAGGVTALLTGGVTWRLRVGSLTQVAFMGGVWMTVLSGINFAATAVNPLVGIRAFGGLLVAIGIIWTALGLAERVRPVRTALSLGCSVCFFGTQMLLRGDLGEFAAWAGYLGIALGIGGIAASIRFKRAILLGFGALAVIVFSMTTVMELFGGRLGAPVLLLSMGVVLIVVAAVTARVASRMRRAPRSGGLPGNPIPHA